MTNFLSADTLPIIAILRGITTSEVDSVFRALLRAGVTNIEIPLNSPKPYESISAAVAEFGNEALIGAGTVLTLDQLEKSIDAGSKLIVSPNTNTVLIKASSDQGIVTLPGTMTPSEIFTAKDCGATGAKLFPVRALGEGFIGDIKSVLPAGFPLIAVGGVDAANASKWLEAGADALGVGSSIYRPGDNAETVYQKALDLVDACKK